MRDDDVFAILLNVLVIVLLGGDSKGDWERGSKQGSRLTKDTGTEGVKGWEQRVMASAI